LASPLLVDGALFQARIDPVVGPDVVVSGGVVHPLR